MSLIADQLPVSTIRSDSSVGDSKGSERSSALKQVGAVADDLIPNSENDHSGMVVPADVSSSSPAAWTANNGLTPSRSSCKETTPRPDKKIDVICSTAKKRKTKAGSHLRNLLAPTYKTRCVELKRLFKLPDREKLVVDYSCAYQKEILLHGRMYLSQNWLCFYSNIFKWETTVKMNYRDIVNITKERTAKIIPNAIYVTTSNNDRLFFTSFSARDKTFMMLFRLWQLALLDQVVAPVEMWSWARHGYDETDLYESSADNDDEEGARVEEVSNSVVNHELYRPNDFRKRRKTSADKRASGLNSKPLFAVGSSGDKSLPVGEQQPYSSSKVDPMLVKHHSNTGRLDSKCHSLGDVRSVVNHSRPPHQRICSDSSENDEDEVLCPCATHEGREFLNSVYPLSVDQLFLWLFTDSDFFNQFQNLRKTKNLILSDWKIDKDTNAKLRQISYSVAVNHALAPKSCEVVEKQECMDCSKAGHIYVIKVEVQNFGIPYSDVFQVVLSYCLTRMSSNQSRLRINGKIMYRKSCWGIIKSVIEKNALFNMLSHFSDLGNLLRYECHRLGLTSSTPMDENQATAVENKIVESLSVNQLNISSRQNADNFLDSSNLETYLQIIVALLFVLVAVGVLILYNQWNAPTVWKAKCDSQIMEALSRQLYRVLLEEAVAVKDASPVGAAPPEWILELSENWTVKMESALQHLRDVEASINTTVRSLRVVDNAV